jgi:hypothetical protein
VIALAALVLAGSADLAAAQTRTPTSPLDTPEQARPGTTPVVPGCARRRLHRHGGLPGIALPDPRAVASEPLDLSTLLPEGLSSSLGLTPEAAMLRAREVSLDARRARARTESADAAVQGARRGYVPRASLTARYTRLSSFTPGTIRSFDTPGCLADVVACQADPDAFLSDVVLQQPILEPVRPDGLHHRPPQRLRRRSRHELEAARLERDASLEAERGADQDNVCSPRSRPTSSWFVRARSCVAQDAVGWPSSAPKTPACAPRAAWPPRARCSTPRPAPKRSCGSRRWLGAA